MAPPAPPPLKGIRVLEFAGLAPGPFAGMLLADYGASVLRIDRPAGPGSPPAPDVLARRKRSAAVDLKSAAGVAFIKAVLPHVDVVIDPFRPGVLEKAGLCPHAVMLPLNRRLVVGRLTGFRRDGPYAPMAGHDINYIALSGVLDMIGRPGQAPVPPGNVVADFAGGGAVCALGILMALFRRDRPGSDGAGQVVEANMVDGSAYLATFPRMATLSPLWDGPRGTNLLDGGCPYYDSYETKDGKYMAVGALEPQFYALFINGLGFTPADLPAAPRDDRASWPALRAAFARAFRTRTRAEWEAVFDGTDACVTPVLSAADLRAPAGGAGGGPPRLDLRPAVALRGSPGLALAAPAAALGSAREDDGIRGQGAGVDGDGWAPAILPVGAGGREALREWAGWEEGREYVAGQDGALEVPVGPKL